MLFLNPRATEAASGMYFSRKRSSDYPLRKEVIQPQVPLRLPCYDLVPITELAVGACPTC